MRLDEYTTQELKDELKRRAAVKRRKRQEVRHCCDCTHCYSSKFNTHCNAKRVYVGTSKERDKIIYYRAVACKDSFEQKQY